MVALSTLRVECVLPCCLPQLRRVGCIGAAGGPEAPRRQAPRSLSCTWMKRVGSREVRHVYSECHDTVLGAN